MNTNPWMIVSLVLACICGFLVGVLVSNPGEVSAEPKNDWEYSTNYSMGKLIATRWDKSAEAPLPEMMILTLGGDYKDADLDEVLASPGKWCETVLLGEFCRLTRGLDAEIERLRAENARIEAESAEIDASNKKWRENWEREFGDTWPRTKEEISPTPSPDKDAEIEKQLEGQGLTEAEKEILRKLLREQDQ